MLVTAFLSVFNQFLFSLLVVNVYVVYVYFFVSFTFSFSFALLPPSLLFFTRMLVCALALAIANVDLLLLTSALNYTIGTPCTSIISSWGDGRGGKACKCGGVALGYMPRCGGNCIRYEPS